MRTPGGRGCRQESRAGLLEYQRVFTLHPHWCGRGYRLHLNHPGSGKASDRRAETGCWCRNLRASKAAFSEAALRKIFASRRPGAEARSPVIPRLQLELQAGGQHQDVPTVKPTANNGDCLHRSRWTHEGCYHDTSSHCVHQSEGRN